MTIGRVDTIFSVSGCCVLLASLYAAVALPRSATATDPTPPAEPAVATTL